MHKSLDPCSQAKLCKEKFVSNIMSANTSNESCYRFSSTQFDVVLRVKLSMDSLGILACLIALAVIILSKAYKRHVFRLVLYFLVADIFQAITHIVELTPIEHVNGGVIVKEGAEGLCAFYGFLDQIALWMCNVAIIWIMLYMLWIANKIQRVQRGASPTKNKIPIKIELIGLIFLLFFPLTFNWIPFIWNMYGISGLWCWIKESRSYCEEYGLGTALIFSLYYGPLIIIITFSFVSLMAITSILCKGAFGSDVAQSAYSRCIKHTILIALYPLVYNLLCLLPIANRVYSAVNGSNGGEPFFPLWIAHTLAEPARILIPPVAFLLHPGSWKTMFRICRRTEIDSSRTPPLVIPPEDSTDIDEHIIIETTDARPGFELYGTMIRPHT